MITAESFRGMCASVRELRRGREDGSCPPTYAFAAYVYVCLDEDGGAARRRADEHLAWRYDEPRFTGELAGKYAVAGDAAACAEGLAPVPGGGRDPPRALPDAPGRRAAARDAGGGRGGRPAGALDGPELGRNGRRPVIGREAGPEGRLYALRSACDLIEAREGLPVACPAEGVRRDQVAGARATATGAHPCSSP